MDEYPKNLFESDRDVIAGWRNAYCDKCFEIHELKKELAALRAQIIELQKEVTSPVLVATNRLADSLADVRAENEQLRAQVEEKDKAIIGLKYLINNPSAWDHFSQNVSDYILELVAKVDQEARAALATTGKEV